MQLRCLYCSMIRFMIRFEIVEFVCETVRSNPKEMNLKVSEV
jgi:hypothetical protein